MVFGNDNLALTLSSGGNVTIGTAAAQDFYLALRGGVGGFFGWDDSANKTIVQAPNTRSLSFQVNSDTFGNGTEAMSISSGGDVTFTGTAPNSGDEITQLNFYNTSSSLNLARITAIRQAGGIVIMERCFFQLQTREQYPKKCASHRGVMWVLELQLLNPVGLVIQY